MTVGADISDAILEEKWCELTDIPFDSADTDTGLALSSDWWIFNKGADLETVWHFFDQHSKGVAFLLYGIQ